MKNIIGLAIVGLLGGCGFTITDNFMTPEVWESAARQCADRGGVNFVASQNPIRAQAVQYAAYCNDGATINAYIKLKKEVTR